MSREDYSWVLLLIACILSMYEKTETKGSYYPRWNNVRFTSIRGIFQIGKNLFTNEDYDTDKMG